MARTKQTDFDRILIEYRKRYNVESLDSPNDIANLHSMIRNQLLIEKLQARLEALADTDDDIDPAQIKKILDSLVALSDTNMGLERTLGIDRKTRKQEASESVADYLETLAARASEWLDSDERLLKVYCKKCGIMVGRISGVYSTTEFEGIFQCPQCNKRIAAKRQERDVFFGVKDAEWRRKYPIEVEQAKRTSAPIIDDIDNELTIGNSYDTETEA